MRPVASTVQSLFDPFGLSLIPSWRLERLPAAQHFQRLFRLYAVDAVLDVGANTGQFRDFLRREVGFSGWIFSFEPAPQPLAVLREKARSDRRWKIFGKALGPREGMQTLHVARRSTMSSFRVPEFAHTDFASQSRRTVHEIDVEVTTLDRAWGEVHARFSVRRPFLKLDTQGYDLEVVRGGASAMEAIVALQVELSLIPLYKGMPAYAETIKALGDLDFVPTNFFPVASEPDLSLIEFDCTMVKRRTVLSEG